MFIPTEETIGCFYFSKVQQKKSTAWKLSTYYGFHQTPNMYF